jgi:hypothetical protein
MEYVTSVVLGEEYEYKPLNIKGIANGVSFFQHGCDRVGLEYNNSGSIEFIGVDALSLEPKDNSTYVSDVVVGKEYKDKQTSIKGIVTALTFYQHGQERAELEWTHKGEVKTATFDVERLEGKPEQSSIFGPRSEPVSSPKSGGPGRGVSNVRRGAITRR